MKTRKDYVTEAAPHGQKYRVHVASPFYIVCNVPLHHNDRAVEPIGIFDYEVDAENFMVEQALRRRTDVVLWSSRYLFERQQRDGASVPDKAWQGRGLYMRDGSGEGPVWRPGQLVVPANNQAHELTDLLCTFTVAEFMRQKLNGRWFNRSTDDAPPFTVELLERDALSTFSYNVASVKGAEGFDDLDFIFEHGDRDTAPTVTLCRGMQQLGEVDPLSSMAFRRIVDPEGTIAKGFVNVLVGDKETRMPTTWNNELQEMPGEALLAAIQAAVPDMMAACRVPTNTVDAEDLASVQFRSIPKYLQK